MISLCIISRKEDEEALKNAVKSCVDYVGEVVIIDTTKNGSITEGILSDIPQSVSLRIIPFTWIDDFSAARNFSFEKANGDILFWIDSDDIVTGADNLPKLAKEIEEKRCDWIYSKYNYHRDEWGNIDSTHWKPRLFRKGTVKWEKSIHENSVPTCGVIQVKDIETEAGSIVIEHQTDKEHDRSSLERNLGILMTEYATDGENTDPRTIQYLGITLEGLERYAEAIPFLNQHIARSGSNSDRFWSLHRLQKCLYKTGDIKSAISVCLDSLKLFPEWKTGYFDLANIYYELGDWSKVIEWTLTGLDKQDPDVLDVISELDYGILPLGKLCEAYRYMMRFDLALDVAKQMMKINPNMPLVKEIYDDTVEMVNTENYVKAFLKVASEFYKYDRIKTAQLFDLLPSQIDDDIRIQQARGVMVPPRVWEDNSVVIYCGDTLDEWAYPSIFKGIGGSEEAVINMADQLSQKGYQVTVYNKCGSMRGTYNGVEYKPYYHFNPRDVFQTLISWRIPALFLQEFQAKKKYLWLHDILYPEAINDTIIQNVDKILYVSKWHSENVPSVPVEKRYITNNGINKKDFEKLPPKRPYSLVWSSSYDRGLLPFIKNIWPLIVKEIPDVTLDVAYGWGNILKTMKEFPHLEALYKELAPILDNSKNITHHGRLSHKKLAELIGSSMVYPYASEFGETCNITSMKCQAAGTYVITCSGAGGTHERVRFGKVIECTDIYTNTEKQQEFAKAVIDYLKNPKEAPSDVADGFLWSDTANEWVRDLL